MIALVTGVSRYLGGRLAAELAARDGVERVIGVDTVPPSTPPAAGTAPGRVEFVRADVRTPVVSAVIETAGVDTVVHLNAAAPPEADARASARDHDVIGTMQLLAACQKAPSLRRLVVRSTSAVYGASPRSPAVFTEDMEPYVVPTSGFARDATEIEDYVRGFARRRPDVALTVLRFADVVGPRVDSSLAAYLALPLVPTVLGADPRFQLLHEDDAVEVLLRTTSTDHAGALGTVNVGGDGVLLLSQAIRRAGRVPFPVPAQAIDPVASLLRRGGRLADLFADAPAEGSADHSADLDLSADEIRRLNTGRVLDTARMKTGLGFVPAYSTRDALDDYVRGRGLRPVVDPGWLTTAARWFTTSATRWAGRGGTEGPDAASEGRANEDRASGSRASDV